MVPHLGCGFQQKALARGGGVMLVVKYWKRKKQNRAGNLRKTKTERPNVGSMKTLAKHVETSQWRKWGKNVPSV